jgi:hypothetical protein
MLSVDAVLSTTLLVVEVVIIVVVGALMRSTPSDVVLVVATSVLVVGKTTTVVVAKLKEVVEEVELSRLDVVKVTGAVSVMVTVVSLQSSHALSSGPSRAARLAHHGDAVATSFVLVMAVVVVDAS